jgi:hypothetical protein
MVKAGRKRSTKFDLADLAAYVLREAKLGNTEPLAGYLSSGGPVTAEQRKFLGELLRRVKGERGKDELRGLEKRLIAHDVKDFIEQGLRPKAAINEVMKLRGRSRATIYAALRESKKRR